MIRRPSFAGRWRCLLELGMIAAVVVSGLLVFNRSAEQLESRGDEWIYLHSSRYFANLYAGGGPANPEWADGYWTHLQPMMLSYALGAWLTARGYDVYQMPRPRISTFSRTLYNLPFEPPPFELTSDNFVIGRVPDKALLADGRALMVAFAAGAVVLAYLVGRMLAGPIGGLAAAALVLARPITSHELVWIQTESLLIFFILLALLIALLGARRGVGGSLPMRWAIPLGIALGLAFGTKLTAALSLVAIGVWLVVVATVAAARALSGASRTALSDRLRLAFNAGRGWLVALLVAFGVFVLSNPHLYANPILHTSHLFEMRADYLEDTARRHPTAGIAGLAERIDFVVRGSLMGAGALRGEGSVPRRALSLGVAGLALIGLLALGVRVYRAARGGEPASAEGLVLVTVLIYFVGVSAAMGLSITRYLLPTAVLGTLLSGIGLAALIGAVLTTAARVPHVGRLVAETRGLLRVRHA